jgi:hypothetical protein
LNTHEKSGKWLDRVFKIIVFFAVLGSIMLFVAANFLSHTLGDITSSIAPSAPEKSSQTTTAAPTAPAATTK